MAMNGPAIPAIGIAIFSKLLATVVMPAFILPQPAPMSTMAIATRTAVIPQPGWMPKIPRIPASFRNVESKLRARTIRADDSTQGGSRRIY